MSGYQLPDGTWVTASWQDHRDRTPPSGEPGTDYGCSYGSPIYAPEAGKVIDRKTSNSGAMGRYVTLRLDDGRTTRCLHLDACHVGVGDRVARGQKIGTSGASGNGSDWYYGPHVHQTLWPGDAWEAATIDFEKHVGPADPPPEPPKPKPTRRDDDMPVIAKISDSDPVEYIMYTPGSGQYQRWTGDGTALDFVRQITGDREATLEDIANVSKGFYDEAKQMSPGYREGLEQAIADALARSSS